MQRDQLQNCIDYRIPPAGQRTDWALQRDFAFKTKLICGRIVKCLEYVLTPLMYGLNVQIQCTTELPPFSHVIPRLPLEPATVPCLMPLHTSGISFTSRLLTASYLSSGPTTEDRTKILGKRKRALRGTTTNTSDSSHKLRRRSSITWILSSNGMRCRPKYLQTIFWALTLTYRIIQDY